MSKVDLNTEEGQEEAIKAASEIDPQKLAEEEAEGNDDITPPDQDQPENKDKPEDKGEEDKGEDTPKDDDKDEEEDEDKDQDDADQEDQEEEAEADEDKDQEEDKGEGEPEPDKDKKPPKEAAPDYEEKFKQSSRQAQSIAESKKQLEEAIDKAYQMPEPTEEQVKADLQKDGINYDELSDFEKRQAKQTLHNKNINETIRQAREEQKATEENTKKYVNDLEVHAIKPDTLKKYPALDGRENELKKFVQDVPTRIGMNFDDVIALFLVRTAKPKKENKGGMFPTGQGGRGEEKPKPNDGKMTLAQADVLRRTDYKKYREAVENDKIDFSSVG